MILALGEKSTASQAGQFLRQTILREGEWSHKNAPGGKLVVDKNLLDELKRNFDAGVGLADKEIPAHIGHTEHKDDRAVAWATVAVEPDPERPGKHHMVALAKPTSDDTQNKILGGEYRYVSPTIAFGFKDNESGRSHKAVLRNYAYTNYPYLKKMGAAQVVNLSEIAEGEGETIALDGFDGTPSSGDPNFAGLPAGVKPEDVPTQCHTCAQLGNKCPFAATVAADDIALKQAAAGAGNCPQYVEADSQTPGNVPDTKGQKSPMALAEWNPNELSSAPSTKKYPTDGPLPNLKDAHVRTLKALQTAPGNKMTSFDLAKHTTGERHTSDDMVGLDDMDKGGHWAHLVRHGLMSYTDMHPDDDSKIMGGVHFHITPRGTQALKQQPKTTALSEREPMAFSKTSSVAAALARVAQLEVDEQRTFITMLSDTHELPADALKEIEKAFKAGREVSIKLSEAIEANEVALSESDSKAVFEQVDLSDSIVISRADYRKAILAAAGAPRTGTTVDGTRDVANPNKKTLSLSERLDAASPDNAVKIMRDWEKEQK